jgi:hypothetical protein
MTLPVLAVAVVIVTRAGATDEDPTIGEEWG